MKACSFVALDWLKTMLACIRFHFCMCSPGVFAHVSRNRMAELSPYYNAGMYTALILCVVAYVSCNVANC